MKTNSVLLIISLLILLSCGEDKTVYYVASNTSPNGETTSSVIESESLSYVGSVLDGEHKVRNIKEVGDQLFFQWKNNEQQWVTSKLPLTKIRYQHHDKSEPTIKFKWRPSYSSESLEDIMEKRVIYLLILTNEEH